MSFKAHLKLGGLIGEGNFGQVFEGEDEVRGKVAVKVLQQATGESDADWTVRRDTLLNEGQNLSKAEHPNIVRVHYIVRDLKDDLLHLVTEFCDGGSLQAPYEKGPMRLSDVRKVATDAGRGLAAIHSCGMVHRDVKPSNILKHGATWKIADFGLVSDNLVLGYASAAGYVDHLAPEVHQYSVTGPKSDIWALGMTVYRLFHGHDFYQRAFNGRSVEQLVIGGGFSRKLPWLPHIPNQWRKFIRKALHDDTNYRFQSATEMSQALASLPVSNDWICVYSKGGATWTLRDGNRNVIVEWTKFSARQHRWSARRTGGGKRDVCVGGCKGKTVSMSGVQSELEEFFNAWT